METYNIFIEFHEKIRENFIQRKNRESSRKSERNCKENVIIILESLLKKIRIMIKTWQILRKIMKISITKIYQDFMEKCWKKFTDV